jgi:tetratricopeptide (TPR) repeat protein
MAQEQLETAETAKATKKAKAPNGAASPDALDAGGDETPTRAPTSFARFLRDVLIVAVLLGGGAYTYRNHVLTKDEVAKLSMKAIDKSEKDDLASLKEAEAIYKQILTLDGDNARGLLGIAETYFYMSQHGEATRPQAEEYLKKAQDEKSESADLFALDAYLKITGGKAAEALRDVKVLLEDKGIGSSKILHAYGWAQLEQGDYVEANRLVRGALDTDFNAVRFALTLAEIAHRQGEERAAVKNLRRATEGAMNPQHEIALAWMAALSAKNYGNLASPAKAIQDVTAKKDKIGAKAAGYLAWAEGELALAMGNADGAVAKADEAAGKLKDFAPVADLKARILVAQKKLPDAVAAYEAAIKMVPEYRGIKLDLIKLKTQLKDDGALALIDELQKSATGTPGPEFELLRGEHYLAKGDVEKAKEAFTKAADLGDDPAILFGIARVTFLEEKGKDKKADLEKVATAFEQTIERRSVYPEAHAYMGEIAIWNFDIGGAGTSFGEAEKMMKKLNRPIAEMLKFYDGIIGQLEDVKGAPKAEASKAAVEWKKKKEEYLASILTQSADQ